MSDRAKTGGPAFPNQKASHVSDWAEGMTIRDWFASQALHVTLSRESFGQGDSSLQIDVARAYRVADAMLQERER